MNVWALLMRSNTFLHLAGLHLQLADQLFMLCNGLCCR